MHVTEKELPEDAVPGISRREALSLLAGVALGASAIPANAVDPLRSPSHSGEFRIRTLTAGTPIENFGDTRAVESTLKFLAAAKKRFEGEGYEVQTVRITLNPLLVGTSPAARADALPELIALDALAAAHGALLSIGPVFGAGDVDESIGEWASHLVQCTRVISFSGSVASVERGVHRDAIQMASRVNIALAGAAADGVANFRFAAAASVPAGTPFFPVGYHEGLPSFAVGIESPNLVLRAFENASDPDRATERLRTLMNAEFKPVELLARMLAEQGKRRYLGIDSSPAPGAESSIGRAIEALTRQRFGAASTLQACAAVTAAIKSLDVATFGYSGLMLPILEDPVLAAAAVDGRVKISDLLLYSTVCGTGLDLVPIAGDSSAESIARVIGDVATLAVRLRKPLSARLFLVPGKQAGDDIRFTDPLLCPSKVMELEPQRS
jgi:uncharacterized protein (UPF0210 family)